MTTKSTWRQEVRALGNMLRRLSFRDKRGVALEPDAGFSRWRELTVAGRRARRTVYLIGNGASASMASHFAADLAKNGHLHTEVFSDLSLITAISNDISYEQVFALPLQRRGCPGDMLIAISSSGRSPNILAAVQVARTLEMKVITLSGMKADNPLRALGDLNIYVPGTDYGVVETSHAAVLHRWMDLVEVKSS